MASRKFKVLTKYIGKISNLVSYGEWFFDHENDVTREQLIMLPPVHDELVDLFVEEFYQFSDNYPEYKLTSYESILESNDLRWDDVAMRRADETSLDAQCILALIMGAIRADRFYEGTLLSFFEDGYIVKWLKRLKCII